MQDIQKLLQEAQKLTKKKTPQELLAEAQEYVDGRKYGRKGKDGQSIKGEKGDKGDRGEKGEKGDKGERGERGINCT